MESLQIYNRATGAWSERYFATIAENWVLDKSTDSTETIKFEVLGLTEPPFTIGDWARIMHVATPSETATYTAEGLPINHTQYIIGAIDCKFNRMLQKWWVSVKLIEPIERTNGIIGETLSFTNQTSKKVDSTTYTKDPYNHYTALRRWLMLTPANCDTYDSSYTHSTSNISWYNRIKVLDNTWLATLPFADTTYNELSLYNVLMDNFDSSTGRTPVMYFDINPSTDLPYNNARDEYLLKFERQDGFDKPILQFSELTASLAKNEDGTCLSMSKSMDNYATGLVSNVTNLSTGVPVQFPCESLYAVPEIDDDTVRSTISYDSTDRKWVIKFPQKVKRVSKIVRLTMSGNHRRYLVAGPTYVEDCSLTRETDDLSSTIKEKKQYYAGDNPDTDDNAIWYEEGGDVLNVRGYYYNDDDTTAIYYIEYEPLIDCRVIVGESDYMQQINQSSSQVDAEQFAAFMSNYKNGMNKSDIIFKKNYYQGEFDLFKDHLGCRVQDGTKIYMITNLSYMTRVNQYIVSYQLNQDHFRKNNSYQASQQVRENIAIATDSIKDRRISIKQKIKIGLTPQTAEGYQFLEDKKVALSGFVNNVVSSSLYPQIACIETSSVLTKSGGTDTISKKLFAPIARFIYGNSIQFSFKYFDNAMAGKQKTNSQFDFVYPSTFNNTFAHTPFKDAQEQLPVLYTDYFGEVQKINVYLSNIIPSELDDVSFSNSVISTSESGVITANFQKFLDTYKTYKTMSMMPQGTDELWEETKSDSVISVENQVLLKDQLEGFGDTIGVEYEGSKAIICKGLMESSRLMRQVDPTGVIPTEGWVRIDAYSVQKSENDDVTTDKLGSSITPNTRVMTDTYIQYSDFSISLSGVNFQSIIVRNIHSLIADKMIILNDFTAEQKAEIQSGVLKIYFA